MFAGVAPWDVTALRTAVPAAPGDGETGTAGGRRVRVRPDPRRGQNADSSSSIRDWSMPSASERCTVRTGRTLWAKNFAAAILPV